MEATRSIDDGSPGDLDEQLVAYLDGELDDNQRAAIEERLMEDPACKLRMRSLQQTFDMLDELPRTTVNNDFARTTVEMIAVHASQELEIVQQRRPWKFTAATVGLLFSTAITFLVGIVIVRGYQREQQRELLEGLAVAEHLRAYSQVKSDADLKFFASLAELPSWQDHVSISRDLEELPIRKVEGRLSAVAEPQRTTQLAEMPADLKRDLQLQYEQFVAQPEARQAELKAYVQQIEARADAGKLTETLVSYVDWLDTLSPPKQTKVQSASAAERLAMVTEMIDESRKGDRDQLAAEDLDTLYQALLQIARSRVEQLRNLLPPEELAELQRRGKGASGEQSLSPDDVLAHLLVKTFVIPKLRSGRGSSNWNPFPWMAKLSPITSAEQSAVRNSLGPKAKQFLQNISDSSDQENRLFFWAMFATWKRSPIDGFGNNPLDAYESADAMLRERLDLSDPSEALKALRSRGGRGGMRFPDGRGGDGRGPDSRGGDGRGPEGRSGEGRGPGPKFDSDDFDPGKRSGPPRGENRPADRSPRRPNESAQ